MLVALLCFQWWLKKWTWQEDVTQLHLFYPWSFGSRKFNLFCSTDHKCKWNQGKCTSDDQHETDFRCLYDGITVNWTLPIISPIISSRSNLTTSLQFNACKYSKKIAYISDPKFIWNKVRKRSNYLMFSCSFYLERLVLLDFFIFPNQCHTYGTFNYFSIFHQITRNISTT